MEPPTDQLDCSICYNYILNLTWGLSYTVALCIFLCLSNPVLDLLIRPLRRSVSDMWDLQLTNQIALFVTNLYYKTSLHNIQHIISLLGSHIYIYMQEYAYHALYITTLLVHQQFHSAMHTMVLITGYLIFATCSP